jgi:hypothetical protein
VAQVAAVKTTASNVFMRLTPEFGMAFDNDSESRWAPTRAQAGLVPPISALAIQRVRIEEAGGYTGRVKQFEFSAETRWRRLDDSVHRHRARRLV